MSGGIAGLSVQRAPSEVCAQILGAPLEKYNLGTVGNTVAGIVGGGCGAPRAHRARPQRAADRCLTHSLPLRLRLANGSHRSTGAVP